MSTPHPHLTPHNHTPVTLQTNTAQVQQPLAQSPQTRTPHMYTEADLIAAGMQYYRTQAGNQNF